MVLVVVDAVMHSCITKPTPLNNPIYINMYIHIIVHLHRFCDVQLVPTQMLLLWFSLGIHVYICLGSIKLFFFVKKKSLLYTCESAVCCHSPGCGNLAADRV